MGVGLGCYAEPKQGGLVGPVAKICFMLRPLYALCDMATRLHHRPTPDEDALGPGPGWDQDLTRTTSWRRQS